MKWQFWFLVSFSLLLVVTFVFYLPTRFERNWLRDELGHVEEVPHEDVDEMHNGDFGGTRYHEEGEVTEGLAVNFNIVPVGPAAGMPTLLQFFVNEKPGNVPVPAASLQIDREKLMHVIGVRSDLDEFFHIHPVLSNQFFAVEYAFGKPGLYKIWSEVKQDGVFHIFGHPPVTIEGEGAEEAKSVNFARQVQVGDYEVALFVQEQMLSFDVHTRDGQKVALEDYLASPMHLTLVKDDLTQLVHAHPVGDEHTRIPNFFAIVSTAQAHGPVEEGMRSEGDIRFEVTFPEAGLYKLFAQFRPQGVELPEDEALLATFWLEVPEVSSVNETEDHQESTLIKPLVSPEWWLYLAVSAVALAVLSFAVHKFVTVKK